MSIHQHKGPGEIEAEVLMTRAVHDGSFLIVEGDDDSRFWCSRVSKTECEIIIAGGKTNVIGGLSRLDAHEFRGALVIVDDDYDGLEGVTCGSPNVVISETHDIECLILRSSALEKLLGELGASGKVNSFEKQSKQTVRDALLERGLAFGRLRWLAHRKNWTFDFSLLKPERFVDITSWQVNDAGLRMEAANQLGMPDSAELDKCIQQLPDADPWKVCQGHDLVAILRRGLQKILGDIKPTTGTSQISAVLRVGLDYMEFKDTQLYGAIASWEMANAPYRILS